tara:strand:+ start:222 stop:446 length:225 start_codon:yes stop_codon:yes gene_type:complete
MATNDFSLDLVDKLAEENIEYLLITIQKGKEDHKSNAYYNIVTPDAADMILTTLDEVYRNLGDHTSDDFKEGAD